MSACVFDVTSSGVAVQISDGEPADRDWERYIEFLLDHEKALKGVLCFAYGLSGPTSKQRKALNDRTAAVWRHVPFAMVSDSRIMRGVMTALAWIIKGNRSQVFAPKETEGAYRFLGLGAAEIEEVERVRAALGARAARPGPTG